MSELASEIRRIARGDKLKGPLGGTKDRDPIAGTFVPFTNTPQNQITANGAEGEDPVNVNAPESNGDSQTGSEQPTDGSDPNTFNKGSATQGSTSNTYDMEDVIDQTGDVPTSPNEPDYSNSGDYSTGGIIDHLSGATDCTTGQCINFHTDGNFPAPEGWDDADTPPVHEYYEEGFYWQTQDIYGSIGVGSSPSQAFYDRPPSNILGSLSTRYELYLGQDTVVYQSSVSCGLKYGGGCYTSVRIYKNTCPGPNSETLAACEAEPPTEEAWPEDGCYDLALKDGAFQTNQYDSEAPQGAGGSKVNFCFGSDRQGTMEVTANGGFMVYETIGGAPTGQATVYGNDGTFQAAGDATDTFMDQWRPK